MIGPQPHPCAEYSTNSPLRFRGTRPALAPVCDRRRAGGVNFQVTVLKILVSYPGGFAIMADLKRDMAILATTGRDWAERTRCLAARVPHLHIFSQGLVERLNGGWRITEKGRAVLDLMEARPAEMGTAIGVSSAELSRWLEAK